MAYDTVKTLKRHLDAQYPYLWIHAIEIDELQAKDIKRFKLLVELAELEYCQPHITIRLISGIPNEKNVEGFTIMKYSSAWDVFEDLTKDWNGQGNGRKLTVRRLSDEFRENCPYTKLLEVPTEELDVGRTVGEMM